MKKLILGVLIGFILSFSTTPLAAVKQYILHEIKYPVFVNGVEYKDSELPFLNYEGSTYVPLAKIGDLTGVNYKWNDELKRVEIITSKSVSNNDTGLEVYLFDENGNIREAEGIIAEDKSVAEFTEQLGEVEIDNNTGLKVIGKNEDGSDKIVLEIYDENGNLTTYTDADDINLVIAQIEKEELPPRISEGWISDELLERIYLFDIVYDDSDLVIKTSPFNTEQKEHLRLNLPEGWKEKTSGNVTIGNVSLKKYNENNYFYIDDLIDIGIMK